eukprot:TRINITY_DN5683_c0_g5_i1.p1 TRINITY_DN5683_c0_g5~~TRINITY_DN5683_c0_g5_i1.p1  ORF type:complete len:1236 (+),score=280.77 TRINITY_DN5683_c0_g5_i1:91-3798(+)
MSPSWHRSLRCARLPEEPSDEEEDDFEDGDAEQGLAGTGSSSGSGAGGMFRWRACGGGDSDSDQDQDEEEDEHSDDSEDIATALPFCRFLRCRGDDVKSSSDFWNEELREVLSSRDSSLRDILRSVSGPDDDGLAQQQRRAVNNAGGSASLQRGPRLHTKRNLDPDNWSASWTEALEIQWREESLPREIVFGAKTLLIVNLMYFSTKLFYYFIWPDVFSEFYTQNPSVADGCGYILEPSLNERRLRIVELVIMFLMFPMLLLCTKRPDPDLYYPILVYFFIYAAAVLLPPFAPSCNVLQQYMRCQHIAVLRSELDCSLQGYTFMQQSMVWILITPCVVPTLRMMNWTWLWIWVVYFGASVLLSAADDTMHNGGDGLGVVFCSIFLTVINGLAMMKKWFMEKGSRKKFLMVMKEKEASRNMYHVLQYMVPDFIAVRMLREPGGVIAEPVERASVLFVMFDGFDEIAMKLEPRSLLQFLNKYFTKFDEICQRNGVTKVETVGEEYVCAVGVVPGDRKEEELVGHTPILGRLLVAAAEMLSMQGRGGSEVIFKMGVHTGPLIAGVIGQKLPRFRLFGDTMNTAARMMQYGLAGELQFGEDTRLQLPDWVGVVPRGFIEMKGKGKVRTYFLQHFDVHDVQNSLYMSRISSIGGVNQSRLMPGPPTAPSRSGAFNGYGAMHSTRSGRHSTHAWEASPFRHLSLAVKHQMSTMKSMRKAVNVKASGLLKVLLHEPQHPLGFITQTQSRPEGSGELQREDNFDKVLLELSADDGVSKTWWQRFKRPGQDIFTDEEEKIFHRWFHRNKICKKLAARLTRQAVALLILTALEFLYIASRARTFHRVSLTPLILRFAAWRMMAILIILAWRCLAARRDLGEVRRPGLWQRMMLLSICTVAVLVFVSYSFLNAIENATRLSLYVRTTPVELLCLPVYAMVTTAHPVLFHHSIAFIFLAIGLMGAQRCYGLQLVDFSLNFSKLGTFLFVISAFLHSYWSYNDEARLRGWFKARFAMGIAQVRVESILNTLMPPMVLDEIRLGHGSLSLSHRYERATIAQSDLCGFTKLASTRAPDEVVAFIGELFEVFDQITDRRNVYKVETVGDAYIAGQAERPLTRVNDPASVVLFGLDMVRATDAWSKRRGENVRCRVGVHTGPCVGGVVGTDMQRYHLFGDIMTVVEVLESTAPTGGLQISSACCAAVLQCSSDYRDQFLILQRQDPHLVTSKGEVHSYAAVGGPTFIVSASS